MIVIGSWLEQSVGQWANISALSQPSGHTLMLYLSPAVPRAWARWSEVSCLPVKQPELPSLFSGSSALIEFRREGTGTCCAALQAPVRKQEQKYSFFYALHSTTCWCGVFLQGVLFLLPLLFFVCTSQVSVPYKDYHERVQHLLLLSARIEFLSFLSVVHGPKSLSGGWALLAQWCHTHTAAACSMFVDGNLSPELILLHDNCWGMWLCWFGFPWWPPFALYRKLQQKASVALCGKGHWWWHSHLQDQLKDVQCKIFLNFNRVFYLSTTVHLNIDRFDKMGVQINIFLDLKVQ